MKSELVCPVCNKGVSAGIMKSWRFGTYEVRRYECQSCKSRFNLYRGPKGTYTIPKAR